MDQIRKTLRKTLEILSYVLIFGFIYRYFSSKKTRDIGISDELEKLSLPFDEDLSDSNEEFEETIKEIEHEKERIDDLSGSSLASEFDSEF